MAQFNGKVVQPDADTLEVHSGGVLDLKTGAIVKTNGTQAAHIADAEIAHDVNATFADTEVEAALDALGAKLNAVLVVLEGLGLVASS